MKATKPETGLPTDWNTFFPRLDALHILDASARFDARWSGRNTF